MVNKKLDDIQKGIVAGVQKGISKEALDVIVSIAKKLFLNGIH